jgi:transmembrane sensor
MNNYKDFGIKDWLEDFKFQSWVYHGESEQFWQHFLQNNPQQAANIEQARLILLSVRGNIEPISGEEVKSRVAEILDAIPEAGQQRYLPWWKSNWLKIAAMLLLTVGLGAGLLSRKDNFDKFQSFIAPVLNNQETERIEITNDSESIRLVNLPDGSSVVLKKNARISYPVAFESTKREVTMTGEAFFEVVKNPEQPFFVYSGSMVTKVKGTSFSIRANEGDDEVKLVVKTGIVEVSALDEQESKISNKKKVILKPNEQVTFNRKSLSMTTITVKKPVLLNLPVEDQNFEYKRTPLYEVFASMEKTYGITIQVDKSAIAHCTLTAKLGDEPVSEKMDMICAVVNAKYETKNGVITVTSGGCE